MTKNDDIIFEAVNLNLKELDLAFSGPHTYTSLFMPQPYGIYLDQTLSTMFINAYIDDAELKHLFVRPLFLLLQIQSLNEKFYKIDKYLRENNNFVYTYAAGVHGGEFLFMYVFECPEKYKADYDKFIDGRYSEFSNDLKSIYHRVLPTPKGPIENPIYGAVFKTPQMKKITESILSAYHGREVDSPVILDTNQEYFGLPNSKYEIFRV